MKELVFSGSAVAIVTPMNADGSINYDEFTKIIDFQISNKTDALVVAGTTGEGATLTHDEHIAVIEHAVKVANKRVPVIAGTGSNDTAYAIELSIEAQRAGADALLSVTPYYNKTSQRGLVRHFFAIADAVEIPIILYNVPSRTGMTITPETYAELAQHPRIVATKEASGNISAIAETANLCKDNLVIYSGNDDQIVPIMALGGKGVISVLANVAPLQTHDMCVEYLNGNVQESLRLQLGYLNLISSLFNDVNPMPVKEAMNMMGFNCGSCRPPLCELSNASKAQIKNELLAAKVI